MKTQTQRRLRVAFVHPDLGLGGAERLVIDAALGLQARGHDCVIHTPHLDPSRCFGEVTDRRVKAHALRVPFPRAILGRLQALCAAVRCALVALWVALFARPDAAVVDIVTLPAAVFALFGVPVLFYCHFPDKELSRTLVRRSGPLRTLYRKIIDGAEGACLRCAAAVAVNSCYTRAVFRRAFPAAPEPDVVHPCVEFLGRAQAEDPGSVGKEGAGGADRDGRTFLLSLNRFERKKNVQLAIDALAALRGERGRKVNLVVAGGYDARVRENVEHYAELVSHAETIGVGDRVRFRQNVSHAERERLLRNACAVLYTPANEHFGIVPLEAMAAGTPVVAVDSGGPRESVIHGETGFLCEGSADAFAAAVSKLVEDAALRSRVGEAGRERVREQFSRDAMAEQFETMLRRICG